MTMFWYGVIALLFGWMVTAVALNVRIEGLRDEIAVSETGRLQSELEAERFKDVAQRCSEKTARLMEVQEATSQAAAAAQENARQLGETYRKRARKIAATLKPHDVAECTAVANLLDTYRK